MLAEGLQLVRATEQGVGEAFEKAKRSMERLAEAADARNDALAARVATLEAALRATAGVVDHYRRAAGMPDPDRALVESLDEAAAAALELARLALDPLPPGPARNGAG
jgi:hypothetical protein